MNSFSAKNKLIMIASIALVMIFLAVFLIFKPLFNNVSSLNTEVQEQKDKYAKLVLEEESYNQARSDLEQIEPRVGQIESLFPVKEELVELVESLELLADTFDSEFTIIITDADEHPETSRRMASEEKPYEVVAGLKNVEVIPFDFQLEGDFLGVINFLQALENQPFYSEIESIVLSSVIEKLETGPERQQTRSGEVLANIRAAFYAKAQN